MMKKSLYVVFVLALIAQICARPADDDKVDPEKKNEDAVKATATDTKDKGTSMVDKAKEMGKGAVDKATEMGKDAVDPKKDHKKDHKKDLGSEATKGGEGMADYVKKHGEDCRKSDAKDHHGGPLTDSMKKVIKVGEEFVKRGEQIIENMFDRFGG